jgi:hypothetical protein
LGWNWKGETPVQVLFNSPDSLLASFMSLVEPKQPFLDIDLCGAVRSRPELRLLDLLNARDFLLGSYGPVYPKSPTIFDNHIDLTIHHPFANHQLAKGFRISTTEYQIG